MSLRVEIDPGSGFCGGVIKAISTAENYLDADSGKKLYSLGAIVHNEEELSRLSRKGLMTIVSLSAKEAPPRGETILIRAHGEPPITYHKAYDMGYKVIDCTCPVVLKLQKDIRAAGERLSSEGQIILYGKIGHAEVLGLMGQAEDKVVVVDGPQMLEEKIASGVIKTSVDMEVFSQTTKDPAGYKQLCDLLSSHLDGGSMLVHNTICRQVASRHDSLSKFASSHDVIVFVAGTASSNGKVLCDLCRRVNSRTYHIGAASDIQSQWFRDGESVGVCGATSTPKWLLEEVAASIQNLSL